MNSIGSPVDGKGNDFAMAFHDAQRNRILQLSQVAEAPTVLGNAARYEVRLEPATVPPDTTYWRVVGVYHLSPDENRGKHVIYVDVVDENGQRLRDPNLSLLWGWEGQQSGQRADPKPFDKPDGEPATNVDLFHGQKTWVQVKGGGLSSDRVENLHSNHPDEAGPNGELWNSVGHHSFYVVFQRARKLAASTEGVHSTKVESITSSLTNRTGGTSSTDGGAEQSDSNPYVGPRTFTYADRNRFFGREREARNLLGRVVSERLLLFYAQSGAGKSSLLHTRLIPQLQSEERFLTLPVGRVSGDLPAGLSTVRNIHLFNLLASIDKGQEDPARLADISLTTFLAHLVAEAGEEDGIVHWHYDPSATPTPPTEGVPVQRYALIIDQFEEIITSHPERWRERTHFFQELNQAMLDDPGLWVVLTLREDFLASLDPYAYIMADRLRARFYMERMGVEAALDAIQLPVAGSNREFTDEAATALVDNLRLTRVPGQEEMVPGQYVEPVQLQVVCYQLWENLRERPPAPITVNDLTEAGDVDESLGAFYETAIAEVLRQPDLKVSEQQLRTWFSTKLITRAGTRGTVYRDIQSGTTAEMPNAAVDILARQFLLRTELRSGGTWVELVHDRFVEPIQRANRARQTPLALDAEAWLAANKDAKRLYEGQKLADAIAEVEGYPEQHSDTERDFVAAGKKAQEARNGRQRQLATALLVVAVALFAILAGMAYINSQRATEASQRAHEAQLLAEGEREAAEEATLRETQAKLFAQGETARANDAAQRAGDLAVELAAARAEQLGVQAEAALDKGYYQEGLLLAVEAIQFTLASNVLDDPKQIASVQRVFQEGIFSVGGVPSLFQGGRLYDVAFSPDNVWLATADSEGNLRLVRVSDPMTTPITLKEHFGPIFDLAFSHDGSLLATAGADGIVALWQTGEQPGLLRIMKDHADGVARVAFSPDGEWLASASSDGTARLWPMEDIDGENWSLGGDTGRVITVAFSPDSKWVATGSEEGFIRLWQLDGAGAEPSAEPSQVALLEQGSAVTTLVFDTANSMLASGGRESTLFLWSLDNPQSAPLSLAGHSGGVSSLEFSLDGRWFASADFKGLIIVWALQPEFREFARFQHDAAVDDVAFSKDSQWLASGDRTGSVEMLLTQSLRSEPIHLRGHSDFVYSTDFSSDNRWLASVGFDGVARLYPINLAYQAELTCTMLRRNLSSTEWASHFGDAPYRRTCPTWPVHESVLAQAREKATFLAANGQLAEAIEQFQQLLELDSTSKIDPATEADEIYKSAQAQELVQQGELLAEALDVEGATALFMQAYTLDPDSIQNPEYEAYRIAAQQAMTEGYRRTRELDLEGAIESFTLAVDLDATLAISPVVEAHRLVGDEMIIDANVSAIEGDRKGAIELYEQAMTTNPLLKVDAPLEAQLYYARGLMGRRAYVEAQAAFDGAQEISPTLQITNVLLAIDWDMICRNGSLLDRSEEIMPACERAIVLDSARGSYYANRAIARALQDDLQGAIDDLNVYMRWAGATPSADGAGMMQQQVVNDGYTRPGRAEIVTRQGWIRALEAGLNPIRASILTRIGRYHEAAAIYKQLRQLNPPIIFSADEFNNICWYGTMAGDVKDVFYACDWALMLSPNNAIYQDSRGLALAALGDLRGASDAFTIYVHNSLYRSDASDRQRKAWAAALDEGYNPVMAYILTRNGHIAEALRFYSEMEGTEAEAMLPAEDWNHLCWYGARYGQARQVLFACDKAIVAAPTTWDYYDSRAVARLLTGDLRGAADDLRYMLENADLKGAWPEYLTKREWLLWALGLFDGEG